MAARRPQTELSTHSVTNQVPPLEDYDLYGSDLPLREAAGRAGALWAEDRLRSLGAKGGSAEAIDWAFQANRNRPQLRSFDRSGQRIDEVEFHPAYHALMALGLEHGVSAAAWTAPLGAGGHAAHAALLYLMAQIEPGVCCPMSMTYAVVPALAATGEVERAWRPRVTSARYDASVRPLTEKTGATIGMAMTEKQGGSDVRANATRAASLGAGAYRLTGHKWFCSAPMSDAFLTLAYAEGGLTCFLVPRWTPDGERNAIHIMRLKDKLGDHANASSEIEYHGAYAERLGEEGRGVRTIIEMVQHTRLDCIIAPAAYMRQSLREAVWHGAHRSAFQRKLIDQPLMRRVLGDLTLEAEAALLLAFRVAEAFDKGPGDLREAAFARIATPVAKYWLNKRVTPAVNEAMEALGGAGYVEESVLPRIYRQSPLNSIWEGSGNVICLDVLRAIGREPDALEAVIAELDLGAGGNADYDRALIRFKDWIGLHQPAEGDARRLTEQLGLLLQASLMLRLGPSGAGELFSSARLGGDSLYSFGTIAESSAIRVLIDRAMPARA